MARGTLADFINELGLFHSMNRYDAVNSSNQLGRFALTEAFLMEIGMVGNDGEPFNNDYSGGWTGKHGINSKEAFLNSPPTQDMVIHDFLGRQLNNLRDLAHYDGQIINGYEISLSGLLGAVSSIESREVRRFMELGGEYNPKWPDTPRISESISRFNGYDLPYKVDQNESYTFMGSDGPDAIRGYAGNDYFVAKGGDDTFDGGEDIDTIVLPGNRSEFKLANELGATTVQIKRELNNGRVEHKEIRNVELVEFADGEIVDLRITRFDATIEEPTTQATVHIATRPVPIEVPLVPLRIDKAEVGALDDTEVGTIGVRKEDERSGTVDA
ncbi:MULTISPECIES: hypothetical protein [unclassified Chelatococcus]|uniref:hypothetical protein n=1 Tax=unclassified Chelatococcus TaxID=2638111 RepID=UPI001BCC9D11|nr:MULTISPECIES: hypothetical protein [unclassified Chelatococcus]MBS7701179.1 hypothetical protein [Chelatococcus sp. YT9]MBX3557310.1 hypothetical protein [Chelatococcus sp.]